MAECRQEVEWGRTAEVLALIYNIHRPAKTKAVPSWKFNPFGEPPAKRRTGAVGGKQAWSLFKALFDRGVFGGQRR